MPVSDSGSVGQWHGAAAREPISTLRRAGFSGPDAEHAVRALARDGLLVVGQYYVPTLDELHRNYREMRAASSSSHHVRWVMCAETLTAIDAAYNGPSFGGPTRVAVFEGITADEGLGTFTRESVQLVDMIGGKLFGVDVRIDPAARRPMWEVGQR